MISNNVTVHQVLHGYVDGHTLIAASLDLPPEARRLMLTMSDMSGSRMETGFEQYVTGYPVKEINKYAIAKTWYAPEMKRPGCVWTHTILLDFSDLPKITDVKGLLMLFQRPDSPKPLRDGYSVVRELVTFDLELLPVTGDYTRSRMTARILRQLYAFDEKSLFVRTSSSNGYDQLCLTIWSQQWPRLKRTFSFCTGSISPRFLNGELMDLQVVPNNSDKYASIQSNVIFMDDYKSEDLWEPWLELADKDLEIPSAEVRRFINYFGSDVAIKRSSFRLLLTSYIFFKEKTPSCENCIEFLSQQFPNLNEAITLKSTLLSKTRGAAPNFLPRYHEKSLLYHLAVTEFYKSFNYDKLKFSARFLDFFSSIDNEATSLLKRIIQNGPNQKGQEVIIRLAGSFVDSDQLSSLWSDKHLLSVFIDLNPKLALNQDFWTLDAQFHPEVVSRLRNLDIDSGDWTKLVRILIEINSPIDISLLEDNTIQIEKIFLDYLNINSSIGVARNWFTYLKKRPGKVLEWFSDNSPVSDGVVALIVSISNPNDPDVINTGLSPWIDYLERLDLNARRGLRLDIHVFYLALAFNFNDKRTELIFVSSFEPVYNALADQILDFPAWRKIEVYTKPLSWWKDWDRCKKMVNALVDFYVVNKWPIKTLVEQFKNIEVRERVLSKYKKRR